MNVLSKHKKSNRRNGTGIKYGDRINKVFLVQKRDVHSKQHPGTPLSF